MNIIYTALPEVYILEPEVFGDARGWFFESFSRKNLPQIAVDFVQDNHSFSAEKGTLRGLHFQINPMAQAKLVRCTAGAVLDVAVDLRKNSPNYLKWVAVELSSENKKEVFIPRGFAHGFLTLTNNVEFLYKADNYYSAENDRSIAWNDAEISVDWGISMPILSKKDKNAPNLAQSDVNFEVEMEK